MAAIAVIRKLTIDRFRGMKKFNWIPAPGLNVILGGGDVGKTTVLEAIALLLNPTNTIVLSDADFWGRKSTEGFRMEAVMSLPDDCGVNQQSKQAWPWSWDGKEATMSALEEGAT